MYTKEDLKQLQSKLETLEKLKESLKKVENGCNKGACLAFDYWRVITYTDGSTEDKKDETRMFVPEAVMPDILEALKKYYSESIKKLESEIDAINIYNFSHL